MTSIRVQCREDGRYGVVIRDNEKPIVRWQQTGKETIEEWQDLIRLDGQPSLNDVEPVRPGLQVSEASSQDGTESGSRN